MPLFVILIISSPIKSKNNFVLSILVILSIAPAPSLLIFSILTKFTPKYFSLLLDVLIEKS
ncbi:MAG: hypothetical protein N3A58_09030 [Spirochaetes bacterium]|nr:hypothetical protein [Spirochaetota bacterium]